MTTGTAHWLAFAGSGQRHGSNASRSSTPHRWL